MATAGDVLRQSLPEVGVGGVAELHVLAVDDSFVDRKVIERLLKFTSCKGNTIKITNFDNPFGFIVFMDFGFIWIGF
jgi:hypothetical protein